MRRCSGRSRCGWPRCTRRSWPISGARGGFPAQGAGAARATRRRCWRRWRWSCAGRARTPSWPRSWRARRRSRAIRCSRRTSWRRWARSAWPRSRTRTARWPRTATPSIATPTTRARARRSTALLDRPETREGALDVLEPLAQARGDYNELLALYERRLRAARRSRRARALAAQDRRGRRRSDRQPGAGAGGARAARCKEEPMPGAALDDLERIAGAAKLPRAGAAKIEAAIGGRRSGRRARAGAAGRPALHRGRAIARRPSGCTSRCWRATRRTSTRCRRWRGCTARRATSSGWRRS